jgi:hypothetical protein
MNRLCDDGGVETIEIDDMSLSIIEIGPDAIRNDAIRPRSRVTIRPCSHVGGRLVVVEEDVALDRTEDSTIVAG